MPIQIGGILLSSEKKKNTQNIGNIIQIHELLTFLIEKHHLFQFGFENHVIIGEGGQNFRCYTFVYTLFTKEESRFQA